MERPPRAKEERTGLYGHRIGTNTAAAALAEAVGTFVLVLAIIATAIAATLATPLAGRPYDSLTVPLAGGLALLAMVAAFGHVSGAHFNPAVTLGLAATRKFPWLYVPAYLVAQFAGALVAALCAWLMFGGPARSVAQLGATFPAAGVGAGRAFFTEAVVTFLLVLVIMAVATDPRASSGITAIAVGFALATAILISGPLTGGSVNPARTLGPMIVAGRFTDWWVYLIAPIVGGVIAAVAYNGLFRKATMPDQRQPSQ